MENRAYKLRVIWRSMNPEDKIVFLDESEQYFMPRLKLEKIGNDVYELLHTNSDIYRPVEDCFVDYAYETSLKNLSDVLCYSYYVDKIEKLSKQEESETLELYKEKLNIIKTRTQTHTNQIKSNYVNKQRENSEAIQEV